MSDVNMNETSSPRYVLITGAGAGFGQALVGAFHVEGWQIIALVRQSFQAELLTERYGERVHPIVADVTEIDCTKSIVRAIEKIGGKLSILINNAGNPGGHPVDPIDFEQISRLFQTHCIGSLRCSKACVPYLNARSGGWIVNVSSRLGSLQRNADREFATERRSYAYRIAKAALNMATLCMGQDETLINVRFIAIHPGQMSTKIGIPDAPHTAEESANLLVKRLLNSDFESGRFYDLYGGEIPW